MKNIYPQGIQISTNIYQQDEIFLPKRLQLISDKVTNIYQKDFKYLPTRWNISIYKNDLAKLMLINLRRGFDTFFGMLQQSTHYRSQQFHSYCTQTSYHKYHKLYLWRKICQVEKFQISVKNLKNLWSFIEIYAVFVLNLCGEKSVWRKNDKYEVCCSGHFY